MDDPVWLDLVLTHHERLDQTGYPNRIESDTLATEAQVLNVADQYCAKISRRSYRQPLIHKGMLKEIFMSGDQVVSPEVAAYFIKVLGFYPPGMLLHLANDEVGFVLRCGEKADTPIVLACTKTGDYNYQQPIERDTSQKDYKVKDILLSTAPKVTFDRRALWPS